MSFASKVSYVSIEISRELVYSSSCGVGNEILTFKHLFQGKQSICLMLPVKLNSLLEVMLLRLQHKIHVLIGHNPTEIY